MHAKYYLIGIVLIILGTLSGCYTTSANNFIPEAPRINTNIKSNFSTNKYKKVGLVMGELGLSGLVEDVFVKQDTIHFIGIVVDGAHLPASNVTLHPCQRLTFKYSKKIRYKIIWDIEAKTDLDGKFELKVPAQIKVDGLVRYVGKRPPSRISTWLYK